MSEYIALIIALGLINPIIEELFWRLYIRNIVKQSAFTLIYTEIHFAAYHWFTMTFLFNQIIGTASFFLVFIFGIA